MKYLFATLLIINSILFVFKSWFYIIFVLFSIIALICVMDYKRSYIVPCVTLGVTFGIGAIVFLFFNSKASLLCVVYDFMLLAFAITCNEKTKPSPVIEHKYPYAFLEENNKQVFPIKSLPNVKNYFDMVEEYYSASDLGLLDHPEDGEYPLYTYKHLPCKLEQNDNEYLVYVETKGWQFVGTIDKPTSITECMDKMENWYVRVDGGSYYDVRKGKYQKKWSPLEFALVILLRNDDENE